MVKDMEIVPVDKGNSAVKRISLAGKAAFVSAVAMMYTLSAKVNVFFAAATPKLNQKESGGNTDFLKNVEDGKDAFGSINKTVQQTGASAFSLSKTIAIIVIVISLIIGFIGIALTKNASKRDEGKSQIGHACIAAMGIGAALGIVSLFIGVGTTVK